MQKVAIILVNYNSFIDTVDCVKSIQSIKRTSFCYEIIVVDNASTQKDKDSEEFLRTNTTYIASYDNLGFSGGNNIGIRYAEKKGFDYILLLNNDTTVKDDFLEILLNSVLNMKNIGIAIGKIYFFSEPNVLWYAGGTVNLFKGTVDQVGLGKVDEGQFDEIKKVDFATGCMMLIPMKVISEVGVLKEDLFLYAEDLEYSLRMKNRGYELLYVPESIIFHKVGASSGREFVSENTQYYMVRNNLFVFREFQTVFQHLVSLIYSMLRHFKYIITARYKFKPVFDAYRDFFINRKGKR